MEARSLPPAEVVGSAHKDKNLVRVLRSAFGTSAVSVTHFDVVHGSLYTMRIFLSGINAGVPDAVSLPKPMSLDEIVLELRKRAESDARYLPTTPPDEETPHKGWEVQKAVVNGEPIVIVSATWLADE
jgi:hypothetical protein